MRYGPRRAIAAAFFAVALAPAVARGQIPPPMPEPPSPSHDCSRWPASVYDDTSATCVCPQGMWWNLRGDACLPREHAAGEFCGTVWPGSQPLFLAAGGYRCVCAPPLLWDAQATGCRSPMLSGEQDCSTEWPGTLPVLSPSGTEFECRCPGGKRWDDVTRTCVEGAPVIHVSRGFFTDEPAPGNREAPAAQGNREAPAGPGDRQAPAAQGNREAPPGPGATMPSAPTGDATGFPRSPQDRVAPGDDGAGSAADAAPPPAERPASPRASGSATCDGLLAEIRARVAAGQPDQADAMGMRAAVAGCDPKAISDAARVRPAPR